MMVNKTAIVFGATGLTGSALVNELIQNMRYTAVKVFARRDLDLEHIKVIEHIVNIEKPGEYSDIINGDDLFICLGTTMRKAGSVKKMEEIDRDLPIAIAKAALLNGVRNIAVVSSIGANPSSRNYYSRIKGELEQSILAMQFKRKVIVRPSVLLGKRSEIRILEAMGKALVQAFGFLLTGKNKKYRGIKATVVAKAMVRAINESSGKEIYESDELVELSAKTKEPESTS
ncbi:MAG: NAD(P)H-binding protein [Bacteroidales bacterium]